MKPSIHILTIFIAIIFINKLNAQTENDTITISNAMAFSLGSKVTLKLFKNNQNSYDYKVIKSTELTDEFKIVESEKLFDLNPEKETVEVIIGIGYYNEGKNDKDFQTVMLLRNNYTFPLQYDADIKLWNKDDFEKTSVVPLYPGTRHTELWPYKIDYIALINFRNYILKKN